MMEQPMKTNDLNSGVVEPSEIDLIPAELREVDAMLSTMASADRRPNGKLAVRSDLNGRIFDATRGVIAANTPAPISMELARETSARSFWKTGAPMRAAAGLALAATLGVAWLGSRGPSTRFSAEVAASTSSAVEKDVSEWLAISETSFVGDLQKQLTSLDAEASGLVKNLESGGSQDSWYDESVSGAAGGAM